MLTVHFTDAWHKTFAGGHVGILMMGPVDNGRRPTPLDEHKLTIEAETRKKYGSLTRAELQELAVLKAYKAYYRKFNKTYHIQLQLESVAHKGKSLPAVNPLVDACFAAELETHLLTASHDVDKLVAPVTIDASTGNEELQMMDGKPKQIKANDMMMTDDQGVVCTIIYGQDKRTPVTTETKRVVYVTYAPVGVGEAAVVGHHEVLLRNVRLFAPDVEVLYERVETAMSEDPSKMGGNFLERFA
jgi:DNA/RNA-binding domain of Phe-tRNA-synthetase-like protein